MRRTLNLYRSGGLLIVATVLVLGMAPSCPAQLRIVSWNTATGDGAGGTGARGADLSRVLDFIGREEVNGVAKPIDVLVLQEQSDADNSLEDFAGYLNAITGTTDYQAWTPRPFATDGLDTGFVYNASAVTPFLEDWAGTGSSRFSSRIGLTPVGYTDASLYIYNTHHTSGTDNGAKTERRDETFDIIYAGDVAGSGVPFGSGSTATGAIGSDANVIYAGDFNQRSSTEEASNDPFTTFISNPYALLTDSAVALGGEAVDPINAPGNWNNNSSFAAIHTQSPHDGSFGLTTGGIDDRFDFQLVSTELNDGEGLSYIGPNAGDSTAASESYRAFGNNGTTFNSTSSSSANTALDWIITAGETLPGLTATETRNAVRTSLARASDHLPVVVDYQLPAVLSASTDAAPSSLLVGQAYDVTLTVENAASVLASLGADELDYTVSVSGDISGGGSGTDYALGAGDDFAITLDTSSPGAKLGTVTVTTTSLDAENTTVQIPISYTVLASLLGDVDLDGDIDADDIDTLYANIGSSDPLYDIDGGLNAADQADVDALVRDVLLTEYGDADLDGDVDGSDFSVLSGNFNSAGGWADGDFNGGGTVDGSDFSLLSGNFNFGSSSAVVIPEPQAITYLAILTAGCFSRIRTRGRLASPSPFA